MHANQPRVIPNIAVCGGNVDASWRARNLDSCREEHDPHAGNCRIPQRLGVVSAQRAGDGYLLESIACLRLVTKEPTIGRLQRIDKTIVLQRSIGSAIGGLRSR